MEQLRQESLSCSKQNMQILQKKSICIFRTKIGYREKTPILETRKTNTGYVNHSPLFPKAYLVRKRHTWEERWKDTALNISRQGTPGKEHLSFRFRFQAKGVLSPLPRRVLIPASWPKETPEEWEEGDQYVAILPADTVFQNWLQWQTVRAAKSTLLYL